MAWAGPETQQISLFLFLLWQEAYFCSGIRIAQGPDEMSVCLCPVSINSLLHLPTLFRNAATGSNKNHTGEVAFELPDILLRLV